jgi:hypothetical protein
VRALRIIRNVVLILVLLGAVVYWAAPIALSFYAAHKALPIARIVPEDLKDLSISQAPGTKLSYLGYEFEVPWTDLDASKTKLYPDNKPDKYRVVLNFRSGLRLMVTAVPPRELVHTFTKDDCCFKMSPPQLEAVFGPRTSSSDYELKKNIYQFTPAGMHHWSFSQRVHARETMLLIVKSMMPSGAAKTGIFNVRTGVFKGFQEGDPKAGEGAIVTLYAADDEVEFVFATHGGQAELTQPEINRIVQSLRKATTSEVATSRSQN